MRLLFAYLLLPCVAVAQPGPPSFCFVLADDVDGLRALGREVVVVQHYRERVPYVGMNGSWLGPVQVLPLEAGPLLPDSAENWRWYHPAEAKVESYVLIIAAPDSMRIDLPEDQSQLVARAWARGHRDTPEVIRFRKGRYAAEELFVDPSAQAAARKLAARLVAADDAAYKRELAELEEYYQNQRPPAPPTPPYTPPPPMSEQDWARYWSQQPPLKQVDVERVSADTVWVRISGRVMLDGGCASGMPLFGLEMAVDTGWVERIPFQNVQMDCGMAWADWQDHVVMLPPLRWWVSAHVPPDQRVLSPGRYRLFFKGGDNHFKHTAPFAIDRSP